MKQSKKFHKQKSKNAIASKLFHNKKNIHLKKSLLIRNEYKYFRKISIKTCYYKLFPFSSFLTICKIKKDAEGNNSSENRTQKIADYTGKVIGAFYIHTRKRNKLHLPRSKRLNG